MARGKNKNIYMALDLVVELDAHADGHGRSAASIVDEALREWMSRHPIEPARRRLVDQRRAIETRLKGGMEEKGIEPRSDDRRPGRDRALRLVAA